MTLFQETITENVALSDTPARHYIAVGILSDDIELDDGAPTYLFIGNLEIIENIELSETLAGTLVISPVVSDTLELSDVAANSAVLQSIIEDSMMLRVSLELNDEVYTAWVVNTRNFAISEYERYNFNSFVKWGQHYYAANNTGIYRLEGDNDAPWIIKSRIRSGVMDFGSEFQKRIPRAYIGLRNNGDVVFKLITNENTERWYAMAKNQDGLGKSRIGAAKGVKSAFWEWELLNADGEDFDLSTIELLPVVLTRRIK